MELTLLGSLVDIAIVSAVILTGLYLYFTWNFDYWKKRGIPFLPPTPGFGNTKEFVLLRKAFVLEHQELYEQLKNERYAGIFSVRRPTLLVMDPDLIKQILVKDFDYFMDRGTSVDENVDPLNGKHLFNMTGEKWRFLRNKLSPTFTSGKMKKMYNLMYECSEELISHLEEPARDKAMIELKDIVARFTTDVIASCAFGIQCNSLKDPDSEFRTVGRKLFKPTTLRAIQSLIGRTISFTHRWFRFGTIPDDIVRFFRTVVKSTMDYRESNNIVRNDFMQLLIQLKNTGKVDDDDDDENEKNEHVVTPSRGPTFEITQDDLTAQVFVFFIGGFETSSSVISFALYELALQPDIQKTLRDEVDASLKKYDGKFTYDSIHEMEYLDMVVQESMRKYPPVPIGMRMCKKDYQIPNSNHIVEKGIRVFIPVFAIQRDPQYYPDPERFDPERFTEENKRTRPNSAFLPFGAGPRICIGMRFGLMQSKLGLASLISKYEFSVCKKTNIPLEFEPKSMILAAKDGIWLQISKRKKDWITKARSATTKIDYSISFPKCVFPIGL